MVVDGARDAPVTEHFANGRAPRELTRPLVDEAPVAIEINGIGYAVMMATPADLDDYALGFCLSEQLIAGAREYLSADAFEVPPVAAWGAAGCCASRSMRRRLPGRCSIARAAAGRGELRAVRDRKPGTGPAPADSRFRSG